MTHENTFLGVKLVYPSSWSILDFADRDSCKPETILFPCSATVYLKIPDALNIGNPRLLISRDVMGQQDCKCDNLTDYLRYKHQAFIENAEESTSTSDFHFIDDNQTRIGRDNHSAWQLQYGQKEMDEDDFTSHNTTSGTVPILGISSGSLQAYAICLELNAVIEHITPKEIS
jgi:hypothetical protein